MFKMLKNMKIGVRLGLGFAIVSVLMIILGVLAITRLASIDAGLELLLQDRYPKTVIAHEITDGINEIARRLRNAILYEEAVVKQELKRIAEVREAITKNVDQLTRTVKSEEGKARLNNLTAARAANTQVQNDIVQLIEAVIKNRPGTTC